MKSDQLSKEEKRRLKKLKGRASSTSGNSPGITSFEEALEFRSLLKKSDTDDNFGPSINHVQNSGKCTYQGLCWKQTEGIDHQKLIQSILFGFGDTDHNGHDCMAGKTNKKRKITKDRESAIPSWCRLHNAAMTENISVIEFSISGLVENTALLMPSHRLGDKKVNTNETDESSMEAQFILGKLVSENGYHCKRALPMRCTLFQGDRPRHPTDLLMYVEPNTKSSKKLKVSTNGYSNKSQKNIYELLEGLTLTTKSMKREGYPLNCDPESDKKYVSTHLIRKNESQDSKLHANPEIFAIDCEMVRTCEGAEGVELARITLLQFCPTTEDPEKYVVALDELVKPRNKITDYLTKWSGINASMMEGVQTTLQNIQAKLLSIICKDDILIGQSLENDLKACRLVHLKVIDTAVLFRSECGRKHSLKHLSAVLLKKRIQNDEKNGHCSEEDATAALLLAIRRARLGDSFQINVKPERRNIFGVIANMRRKADEDQPSYLRYNRGPIVCLGPNDWIKEHVGSHGLVNVLQCDNISSSTTKAIVSYLRPNGRRASILWSRLSIDTSQLDTKAATDKIDNIIVSE